MSNLATITNNILADSGIDDINVVVTNGSYANPAWITSLDWSKITNSPLGNYLPLAGGTMTGAITTPNGTFGIIVGDDSRLADRNVANTLFLEGVQNNDRGYINFSQTSGNQLGAVNGGALTWRGDTVWTSGNITPVTGTGTTNYLPKWSSSSALTNSILYEVNDSIGVGYSNPITIGGYSSLDIRGTTGGVIQMGDTSNQISGRYVEIVANSTRFFITTFNSKPLVLGINGAQNVILTAAGNLLVGPTGDSGYKLDVGGDIFINGNFSIKSANNGHIFLKNITAEANSWIYQEASSDWGMFAVNNNSQLNALGGIFSGAGLATFITSSAAVGVNLSSTTGGGGSYGAIAFVHGTGDAYFQGRIGVGTFAPSQKLDVRGTIFTNSGGTERYFQMLGYNNSYATIRSNVGFSSAYNSLNFLVNVNSDESTQGNASIPSWIMSLGGNIPDSDSFYIQRSGGGSFSFTNLFKLTAAGAATFSSSVTAGGNVLVPAGSGLAWSGDASRIMTPEDNVSGALIQTPGIIRFNAGGTTPRVIISALGALLVGTSNTYSNLATQGDIVLQDRLIFGADQTGNANNRNWSIETNSSQNGSFDIVSSSANNNWPNAAYRLTLTRDGNVGIGTPSPLTFGGITGLTINGNVGALFLMNNGSHVFSLYNDGSNTLLASISNTGLAFGAANIERMRIFNDGNVLIQSGGTFSNNGARLQVSGTGTFAGVGFGSNGIQTSGANGGNGIYSVAGGSAGSGVYGFTNDLSSFAGTFQHTGAGAGIALRVIGWSTFSQAATFSSSVRSNDVNAFLLSQTGNTTDTKTWSIQNLPTSGQFRIRALNDSETNGINALVISRTGISSVSLDFGGAATFSSTVMMGSTTTFHSPRLTVNGKVFLQIGANTDIGGAVYAYNDTANGVYFGGLKFQYFSNASGSYTLNDGMVMNGLGNVGINNMDPSFRLDVNGSARFSNTIRIDGYDSVGGQRAIGFGGNTLGTNPVIYSNGSYLAINSKTAELLYLNDSVNGTVAIATGGGNVGIGTTSTAGIVEISRTNTNIYPRVNRSSTGYEAGWKYATGGTDSWYIGLRNTDGTGSYHFYSYTTNSSVASITNNGNVLIGTTTTPTAVSGVSFPLTLSSSAATRLRIDSTNASPNSGVGLYANGVQKFSFAMYGATSDFTIYNDALLAPSVTVKGNNSNVLIGTTDDNGSKLRVAGGIGFFDSGIRTGTLDTGYVSGIWKLGRAVIGSQPGETHQIIVEINGALFTIGAAAL